MARVCKGCGSKEIVEITLVTRVMDYNNGDYGGRDDMGYDFDTHVGYACRTHASCVFFEGKFGEPKWEDKASSLLFMAGFALEEMSEEVEED